MTDHRSVVERLERPRVLLGVVAAAYLPFTLLGYGTDIDVGSVLQSGRGWIDDRVYRVSRPPGGVVHEIATAALDRAGSYVLVNLVSLLFGIAALWSVHVLLRRSGSLVAGPATVVLATNPWFWIASTSLTDSIWSVGLLLLGTVVAGRIDRPGTPTTAHRIGAGVLFGLATGTRLTTAFLGLAWIVAERLGSPSTRPPWKATLVTAATAAVVGAACFVPPWLWADRSFDFLESGLPWEGLGSQLGRWGVKNGAFFGVLGIVVLLAGLPRLLRARGAWTASVAFRFAVLAFVVTEALYVRFPLKPLHLLPVAVALALVVGHLAASARRWIAVLVAAQLVGALVTTTLAAPDVRNQASTGRLELGPTTGPLLTDVRCRLDDLDLGEYEDGFSPESRVRAAANFDCQLESWRADD